MHYKLFITLAAIALIAAGCTKEPVAEVRQTASLLTVTATVPGGASDTRLALNEDLYNHKIVVRWKAGEKIKHFFKQGETLVEGAEIALTAENLTNDKKTATFTLPLPAGIDAAKPYTLYSTHGARVTAINGKVLLNLSNQAFIFLEGAGLTPVSYAATPITAVTPVAPGTQAAVAFGYPCVLQAIRLKNATSSNLLLSGIDLEQTDPAAPAGFHVPRTDGPLLDLVSGVVGIGTVETPTLPTMGIEAGLTATLYRFVLPTEKPMATVKLKFRIIEGTIIGGTNVTSINAKATTVTQQAGNAYYLHAVWDGTNLQLTDKDLEPVRDEVLINPITGGKKPITGDKIMLLAFKWIYPGGVPVRISNAFKDYTIGSSKLHWNQIITGNYSNTQWSGDGLLPPLGEPPYDFIAYYPYATSVPEHFTVAAAANPDLLGARAGGVARAEPVNLTFKHLMHRLEVRLTSSVYSESELANATVSLKNLYSTARINSAEATVDYAAASGTYAYPSKKGAVTEFIVAPQNFPAHGTELVEITVGGKMLTYKKNLASLDILESGKFTTLYLSINADAVSITGRSQGVWSL